MAELEAQFDRAMMEIYVRAKKETGYTASIFHRMISERGGLQTAKDLINAKVPSQGYAKLWELQRLDLTVEAVVVDNPSWHPLFDEAEIERARRRLKDYGYFDHPRA
jgi:hypothetical protein